MIPSLILYMLPIVILAVGGLVIMMADAFQGREGGLALPTALMHFAAGTAALALWGLAGDPARVADASHVMGGYLAFDRQTLFLDMVIALGGMFASLLAGGYLEEHGLERGEFYVLLAFSSAGCMMLASATDLVSLFIGLETLSLGVYSLTGFRRGNPRSSEAALKYFLLGAFAAALLLYGSALLYGLTGHTDLPGIREALTNHTGLGVPEELRMRISIFAMLLVLAGFAFKIGAVPFHMWTPDAYEGAPTPATAFMAVAVKAAAFGGLLRVMLGLFGDPSGNASIAAGWPALLAWIAVLTMTVANLVALAQTSVKRMLAYSSIAHAGFVLLGVVVAPRVDTVEGSTLRVGQSAVAAVLFYLLAYTVSNAGAFGTLIFAGSRNKEAVSYDDMAGLGRRNPAVALAFSFFVFSLAGVPPTVGFFAKFYVLRATLDAGYTWLAVLAVLNSAIAAYYYLRVLVKMYMHQPAPGQVKAVPMHSGYVVTTLIAAAVFVLWLGLNPTRCLQMAVEAARQVVS